MSNLYSAEYYNLRREVIFEALEKYPTHGNRTVANLLYEAHPEFFQGYEHARTIIRMYRGCQGKGQRKALTNKKYFRNVKPV